MAPSDCPVLLDLLFRRKRPPSASSLTRSWFRKRAAAPRLHYDPGLVRELKADHQALLEAFGQLGMAHRAGDQAGAAARLETFGELLAAHLAKEDARFYTYLDQALARAEDAATHFLVQKSRAEMDAIGEAALGFVQKYRTIAADRRLADSFAADFAAMEKILAERVQGEEKILYPMYLPVY